MSEKYRDYDIVPEHSKQFAHLEKPIRINTQALLDQLSDSEPSIMVELFEIDTARYSGETLYFHNGKTIQGDLVFSSKNIQSLSF